MQYTSVLLPETFVANSNTPYMVHQIETLNALLSSNIVINDNFTGSGKTIAGMLYLKNLNEYYLQHPREFFCAVYVSPINSLLYQTYQDIQSFVTSENLSFIVFPIMKYSMDLLQTACENEFHKTYSKGELLSELFNNPISILRGIQIADNTLDKLRRKIIQEQRPCVYVINPDILYYGLFVHYHQHRNNIKIGMLDKIKYIVFDEFHYYSFYQLNMFFFLLSIWKSYHRFTLNSPYEIKVCLLSATPNKYIQSILQNELYLNVKFINESTIKHSHYFDHYDLFLSPVNLNIYHLPTLTRFIDAMLSDEIIQDIKHHLLQKRYGLIICNSIEDVQNIKRHYQAIGLNPTIITGSINQTDRVQNVESHLIISTNTVDLGFNFNRKRNSKRQNIDFIYIDYLTYDDFIQRIGRAGRILKKQHQTYQSYANLFLSDQVYYDFTHKIPYPSVIQNRNEYLSQFENIMPSKFYGQPFFEYFGFIIAFIGYNEFIKYSLMDTIIPGLEQDEKTAHLTITLLEQLKDVYNVKSDYYKFLYERFLISNIKYNNLSRKQIYTLMLLYYFDTEFHSLTYGNGNIYLRNRLIQNQTISCSQLYQILSVWCVQEDPQFYQQFYQQHKLQQYHAYLQLYFSELRDNYRGSTFELTMKIYDPHHIFGSTEYDYRIFHILKYYQFSLLSNSNPTSILINDFLLEPRKFHFEYDFRQYSYHNISQSIFFLNNAGQLVFDNNTPTSLPSELNTLLSKPIIAYFLANDDKIGMYNFLVAHNLSHIPNFDANVTFQNNVIKPYRVFIGKFAIFVKTYFETSQHRII